MWICLSVVCVLNLQGMAQSQDEIKRRQNELQKLREQIQDLEKKSKQQQANESQVLELLETYDEKSDLLRKLIKKLRGEEQHLQGRIDNTQSESGRLEQTLDILKQNYAKYVTAVYKAGRQYDSELLFTSNSLNQLLIRNEYLQRFSAQRKRDAETIQNKKKGLDELQARLAQQLNEGRRLIAVKGAEEDRLSSLSADRRDALTRIRKDKNLVQQQLQRQMKAARDMEGLIGKLIETERIRKERAVATKRLPTLPKPTAVEGAFEKKKGRLRWPVDAGRIVARFGPQKHSDPEDHYAEYGNRHRCTFRFDGERCCQRRSSHHPMASLVWEHCDSQSCQWLSNRLYASCRD